MHKLVRKLEIAIVNKGIALNTFLDMEGAFDNVSFYVIKRSLSRNCESKEVNRWTMSMIHNRKTSDELQGQRKVIAIRKGCLQGGI